MAWKRGAASAGSLGGVTAGTAAGLVWGLAFLVPVLLHGWSAVAVTSGRYLAYGAVSAILFALGGRSLRGLTRRHWRPALAFAITGNVGYYLLLVLGIELIGAPVTDIVIGCIPVTLALAGNIASRAYAWRKLALPVGLVTAGLLFANIPAVAASPGNGSVTGKALGLLAAFGAVALWTWYGLANARFLNRNPEVPNASWSTLVGLFTGAITLIGLPLAVVTHQIGRPSDVRSVTWLVGGSLVLVVSGVLIVVRRPAAQRGSAPPTAAAAVATAALRPNSASRNPISTESPSQ